MIQDWQYEELEEQLSQCAVLLKKIMQTPDDCDLRNVCDNWIEAHKSYLPDVPKGYDVSQLDGNPNNLNF
jgi:hypothetical protein